MRMIVWVFCISIIFSGCTISMQNISTHGVATDLVDEIQTPDNNFRADISTML